MNALKIGIVEDDVIIARSIAEMLTEQGYDVTGPARRYSEAIELLEQETPDLLLLDIRLAGKMDGIDVAHTLRRTFNIPFIFLTANTDAETLARAKQVVPSAYLAKPITKAQLTAAIEIAVATYTGSLPQPQLPQSPGLFVKDGDAYRRIQYADILFAESQSNYLRLVPATGEEVQIRSTLAEFLEAAPGFVQVHRGFAVAPHSVSNLHPNQLFIGAHCIPVSKTFRSAVMLALGIR